MQVAQHHNAHQGHGQTSANKTGAAHHSHHSPHNAHNNAKEHKCGGFADVLNKAQAAETQPKSAEQKPMEQKPAEQKPVEQKHQPHHAMHHQPHHAAHHQPHHATHHSHNHRAIELRNINCCLKSHGIHSYAKASAMQQEKEDLMKNLQDFLSKHKVAIGQNEEFNVNIDKFFNITVTGDNNEKAKVIEQLLKNKGVAFMG